ncbi:MAG: hypothetical protein GWP69_06720 [Gammaproteobacteria bacterium]|jgi:hypothetical protein|nr:hypothetical protein [Gammaproteobacteria bacterium]NCF82558.1 hypothetical protein [Pseudomonadota bacterium]
MNLYVVPLAPNPTRVRLYVAEKNAAGAEIQVTEIQVNLLKGEQSTAEHLCRWDESYRARPAANAILVK